mgnify:CR=1 FL=1
MADETLFYWLRNLDRLLGDKWQENDGKGGELENKKFILLLQASLIILWKDLAISFLKAIKSYGIIYLTLSYVFKESVLYLSLGAKERIVDLMSLPIL